MPKIVSGTWPMLWVELCPPPPPNVYVLTPGTFACDLIWNRTLYT